MEGVQQIKDDVVVYGIGKEHDVRLRKVLERFRYVGLRLRKEKCSFGQQEVLWFRNMFTKQGMSPDPNKVQVIKNWPLLEDKAATKSFLQTVQFSSTYMRPGNVRTYRYVTKPLRELTRQNTKFVWMEECQQSFEKLKELLCNNKVLMAYDPKRHTRIYVDHGPKGVAATVAQRYDEAGETEPVYRPVTYTSRALKKAERGYSKVEGESLAVLSGIMSNKQYLYETRLETVVDHNSLVPLYNSLKRPSPVRVD